ncbi:MAG TPA: hypothetical protein VMT86_15730 [Bryobacteraceae bacterium]|nr:hypothetical protein [Bryobacteraceae bacterium]
MKIHGSIALKLCLFLVALAPAAIADGSLVLSASPSAVVFQYSSPEPAPLPVAVTITASDGSSPAISVSVTPGANTPSTLFPQPPVSGDTFQVGYDTNTLNSLLKTPGIYTANITVTASGFAPLTVPVSFAVGSTLSIIPSPASLSFTAPSGPTSQNVQLTSAGQSAVSFTLAISTSGGGNWLSVSSDSTYTQATLTVTINALNVPTGTWAGSITVTPVSGTSVAIPVTLQVGPSTVAVSPATLAFSYNLGGTTPPPQAIQVTSPLSGDTYTAQASSSGNWLLLNGVTSQISGSIPATLNVTVSPVSLTTGTYQGTVTVTDADGSSQTVTVSLVVTGISTIANPISLVFVAQQGEAAPPGQTVTIGGSINATYTATTSESWIIISAASGRAPAQITVSVNPAGLQPNTYIGSVAVIVSGHTQGVQVTLTVSANPVLMTGVGSFVFNFAGGSAAPSPGVLQVSISSGSAQSFTYATGLPSWLHVTSTNQSIATPDTLTISLTPQSLATGTYLADIIMTPTASGGISVVVPVLLLVTGSTPVIANPTSLTFTANAGTGPQSQTIQVSATAAIPFVATASTSTGGTWLTVSPTSATTGIGTTPITVTADASSLGSGTYNGAVTLTTSVGVVTQVAVTFDVGTNSTPTTVSPASLAFAYAQGGATPAAQIVQVTGSQGFTVNPTTASGGNWLSVTPTSGSGNTNLSVSVNPSSLAPMTYTGTITVTPTTGSAQTVSVTLVVSAEATLTASPNPLAFAYSAGNPAPAPQALSVTSAGESVTFTATASSGGWLSVTPTSGTTPASLSVSVDPTNLGAGTYQGTIALLSSSGSLQFTVNVTLTVVAPLPVLSSVLNSASYLGGGIAPGEIVVLFGTAIGPTTGVGATIDSTGHIPTKLANVQVTFNGYAGPLLYASAGQVNAIVPYELTTGTSASVEVMFGSARSNTLSLPVVGASPGIFSANASGTGDGAILDVHYNLVSPTNPVSPGDTIQIFATGQGVTSPAGQDGLIEPLTPPWPVPTLASGILIGNLPAAIQYIGAAPGLVAGALQVNAVVPAGVASGAVPVLLSIGSNSSQNGITLEVK